MAPSLLPLLYAVAVLLPLASFFSIWLFANWLGKNAAYIATGAIGGACVLSFIALFGIWLPNNWPPAPTAHAEHHDAEHGTEDGKEAAPHGVHPEAGHPEAAHPEKHSQAGHLPLTLVALQETAPTTTAPSAAEEPGTPSASKKKSVPPYTDDYYTLGEFGPLRMTISYYIDTLTVCMFCMVTLIASLIHCYAIGYMSDELSPVTDREVTMPDGGPLHRPGRFPRFFQYLSLFCFSMLGLVLAGNIAMVFVFWELVGICSYFLIGFYIERQSASTAANKAFIVNRIGDFGMIIGLMALWSSLGTFAFGDIERVDAAGNTVTELGIFSQVRPGPSHKLIVPDGMVRDDAANQVATIVNDHARLPNGLVNAQSEIAARTEEWRQRGYGYWLLVVAGIGIFCGCVGKSAQFPLHTWLPDAMEGPTPVSALVHSATMVAAGVYLVGRFFPVFAPEVLLVIASIGCITMLLGASIAFTAVDIKRVLAYSTVSQLGLMMVSLGVGGWLAGLMHLITHAFFKSLLFMCSGSVIHAVHTNDMRKMGGLFGKMPVTAITMLIGCLAIAGVSLPFVIGFAGYYSKDAILEQAMSFWHTNQSAWSGLFFILALSGAALTSCYMFRMWFMTFVGQPRDEHAYDHAHESPPIMHVPLVVLAILAVSVAWKFEYIGFGLIAAAFFIARGFQQGWFQAGEGHGHGHDHDHGHDHHGHGHDDHGHAAPVHPHDAGGHASHDHAHGHSSEPPFTWTWVAVMLATTIVGGLIVQHAVLPAIVPENSKLHALNLSSLLEQARPLGTLNDAKGKWLAWTWPDEHKSHVDEIRIPVTLMATCTWLAGITLAAMLYWWGVFSPADVRRQFAPLYTALWNKWYFDEIYDALFVQPTLFLATLAARIDKNWIDGLIDLLASFVVWFSKTWDIVADRGLVDGSIQLVADWTYGLGLSLRAVQTGRIRQYVMFIVVGAVAIFVLVSFFWSPTLAR